MVRSVGKSDSNQFGSAIPNQKGKVPTIDELMRRLRPERFPWEQYLPPPAPRTRDPFGPVPIIPAPIEVDPPWHGRELASRTSGGLLGMMERSGVMDPSEINAPPAGGLVELLQEYLRNNRKRSD